MDLGLLAYSTYCYASTFIRTQLKKTKLAMKAKVIETGEVVEVKCTRTAMYSTVDMSGEGNTEKFEETELEFISWRVLRRIGAVGLLWDKNSTAFLGIDMKADLRNI